MFANPGDPFDANAKNYDLRNWIPGFRFDRRQVWEPLEHRGHYSVPLGRIVDLLEPAERDYADPVESVFDLIHLKTNVRVGAHDLYFASGHRVDVDVLAVEEVIDRDDVRHALATTSQTPDVPVAQQFARLSVAGFANHLSSSLIEDCNERASFFRCPGFVGPRVAMQ